VHGHSTPSSKTMKTKQQIVSEFRRQEIINAARSVFARHGFANGIVDQIATEAGLAKGTIYFYFESKDDVYRAVLEHDMEALKSDSLRRIDAAEGLKKKIRAFIDTRLENAEANREFFSLMDTESASLSFSGRQYRNWLQEPVRRLALAIQEEFSKGSAFPSSAEKAAWVIVDITRGAIHRRMLGQCEVTLAEESEFLLNLIWSGLARSCAGQRRRQPRLSARKAQ